MTKILKPSEVQSLKDKSIPDVVFDSINELIVKHWDGHSASFKLKEITDLIIEKNPDLTKSEIYGNGWLDVEDIYRKEGWKVKYEGPAYCESFDAYFEFSK